MQSEMDGTLFFEPLHQESFILELQSLVKLVYINTHVLKVISLSFGLKNSNRCMHNFSKVK